MQGHTHRFVWPFPLAPGIFVQSLCLVAYGALNLDDLLAGAWLTVHRVSGLRTLLLDLASSVGKLCCREAYLRLELVAPSALDPIV